MTKLNTIRACLSLFIVMLKKNQNAVNFILMNDVSETLEQPCIKEKCTSLSNIEVKRQTMFCKLYGACNLTGEIIVIEIVWFTIIDTLKIHNGRTARDELRICA